jgi:hypothetical protein
VFPRPADDFAFIDFYPRRTQTSEFYSMAIIAVLDALSSQELRLAPP